MKTQTANLISFAIITLVVLFSIELNAQWAINAGGNQHDRGQGIAIDGDGNKYVTGFFEQLADFEFGSGSTTLDSFGDSKDIFVAKYNSSGVLIWAIQLGGTGADEGFSLKVDGSGNVYVTGYFQGTADFDPSGNTFNLTSNNDTQDIFFAKYDPNGNILWAKNVGGEDEDRGLSIAIDGSGNVYVTGYYKKEVDFNPDGGALNLPDQGGEETFIAKYSGTDGSFIWAKKIGSDKDEAGNEIVVEGDYVYVTGYFDTYGDFGGIADLTSAGGFDIFFAKYNTSDGSYVWAKNVGGSSEDRGHSMDVDGSGNVYITGYFQSTANFNPGGTFNLTSYANKDVYLAKYDSDGVFDWAKKIGGTSDEEGFSITVKGCGNNIAITGYFNGTANFDPDGTANLTTPGNEDVFVAKYNASDGSYVWAGQFSGTGIERGNSIASNNTNVCVTGYFQETTDFDPSAEIFNITVFGDKDIFITCLDCDGALPVEMTSFSVTLSNNLAKLNWETATEVNNYGFEVQRTSENEEWNKVGFVEGFGNSNSPKYYSFTDQSVIESGNYSYRLKQIDIDGTSEYSDVVNINLSVEEMKYNLNQNYPNPFNPTTTISYSIPEQTHIDLIVYNIFGEEITRLVSETQEVGNYSINFDAENLAAGLYFYTIQTESYTATKKLILLK